MESYVKVNCEGAWLGDLDRDKARKSQGLSRRILAQRTVVLKTKSVVSWVISPT